LAHFESRQPLRSGLGLQDSALLQIWFWRNPEQRFEMKVLPQIPKTSRAIAAGKDLGTGFGEIENSGFILQSSRKGDTSRGIPKSWIGKRLQHRPICNVNTYV
jgi:hypothetical protein